MEEYRIEEMTDILCAIHSDMGKMMMMYDEENHNVKKNQEVEREIGILTTIIKEQPLIDEEELMYKERLLELQIWQLQDIIKTEKYGNHDDYAESVYQNKIKEDTYERLNLLSNLYGLLELENNDMKENVLERAKKVVFELEEMGVEVEEALEHFKEVVEIVKRKGHI
ncbi:hypothetical protein ACFY6E_12425 [Staphylococcus cohnii]|uniref:hypothetical protein n=1 Tax=Staphylococcus cohnii TaxID=29382 RepID=UPI0036A7159F